MYFGIFKFPVRLPTIISTTPNSILTAFVEIKQFFSKGSISIDKTVSLDWEECHN